ncbi:MAG TPA: vitamin K epoxide reductase family protein [Verrucomicrobiales bacterium]|nr:vitamin K epoxide reductase family protein [Verrucomicrobiales bacterium]
MTKKQSRQTRKDRSVQGGGKLTPAEARLRGAGAGMKATVVGRLLLGLAFFLSVYLSLVSMSGEAAAGCGEGEKCQEVLSSRWSALLGLPVSLAGSVLYAGMLVADLRARRTVVWWTAAALIVGGALWFTALQAVVLRAFCPWCCVAHALAAGAVGLLYVGSRPAARGGGLPTGNVWWKGTAAAAAILTATALLQVYGPQKKTTQTVTVAGGAVGDSVIVPEANERLVPVHGGSINVDVVDLPAIGDTRTATHVVVGLFDFTCPHCRELHEILVGIEHAFRGRLAVAQLPGAHNEKGRTIHRLMLSLWKERPDLREIVGEMLHSGTVQADEIALQREVERVMGQEEVMGMLARWKPWADEKIALAEQVFQANKAVTNSGRFPQLLVGDAIEVGAQAGSGHYYALFREKLGLVRDAVPQLTISPGAVDLGAVIAGSPHTLKFSLENLGKADARLRRVNLPMGMRWEAPQPEVVAAGKKAELSVSLEVPLQNGPAACEIQLESDAEPALLKIPVKAQVRNPIELRPQRVNFGTFSSQTPPLKVQILLSEPVTLGEPKSSIPQYQAELVEVEAGKAYELEIEVVGEFSGVGFQRGVIEIPIDGSEFDEPWPEAIRVQAYGRVVRSPGS